MTDNNPLVERIIARYFSDAARTLELSPGQVLIEEGQFNNRLFYVRSGSVMGYVANGEDEHREVLRAGVGDIVGIQSFFGGSQVSAQTIEAVSPTVVAYVERDWEAPTETASLDRQLMPLVVAELLRRQNLIHDMAVQQQQAQAQLQEMEKYSFLGQLAAGVSHELNNALTVMVRGTQWVAGVLQTHMDQDPKRQLVFHQGLTRGRFMSSTNTRERAAAIGHQHGLSHAQARKLAQTGLPDADLADWKQLGKSADTIFELWELGATLNDMQVAGDQAQHVVASMKELGARHAMHDEVVDINTTIQTSLQILRNATRGIEINLELQDVPTLRGNRGEFVQIWSNLIKNACESLNTVAGVKYIHVQSQVKDHRIHVIIQDSGPGIPARILPHVFEPSVTTKKSGLSFGLGLGLSIVKRLVSDYGGQVFADNSEMGARFTVTLPTGE